MKRLVSVILALIMATTVPNPIYAFADANDIFIDENVVSEDAEDTVLTMESDAVYDEPVFSDGRLSEAEEQTLHDDSEEELIFSDEEIIVPEDEVAVSAGGFWDISYLSEQCMQVENCDFSSDIDLFAGYVDSIFQMNEKEIVPSAGIASEQFSGLNAIVYKKMKNMISEVASGSRASTIFTVSLEDLGLNNKIWYAKDLGVNSIISNGKISSDAVSALREIVEVDYSLIFGCLLAESPYELYWFDKTTGYRLREFGISAVYYGAEWGLCFNSGITWSFLVAEEYAASSYVVNTAIGQSVKNAHDNALAIVAANTGKTDYNKLLSYKNAICNLVSYNNNAAEDDETAYGNPWQVIWVFDNKSDTNVVCEGYSKAFQYLCDLTDFSSDIKCLSVAGVMSDTTGSGGHMWNVVSMEDSKNYLVDVTNCDAGTVGADSLLFLAGYSSGGLSKGYTYKCNGYNIKYTYDDTTFAIYSSKELSMSASSYKAGSATCVHAETILKAVTPTCVKSGKTKGSYCSYCGDTIVKQEVIPALGHKWGAWKTTTTATVLRTGVKQRTCSLCGTKENAAIAKLTPVIKVTSSSFKMKTKQILTNFKVSMGTGDYVKSFKSNKTGIVTVTKWNKNGTCTLTAKAAGTAKLTITLASGKKAYVTINVSSKDVATTKISGVKTSATIAVGKYMTLTPVRSPFNSSQKVTYKTSNVKVVKVSSTGKILGVSPGKAIITVASGSKSVKCTVTVPGIRVSSKATVEKGRLAKIQPVKYGISNAFTFKSSNSNIVRVARNGTIKGMAPGIAKITITAGTYKAVCTVTVPGIRGISSSTSIARGKTLRLSPVRYGISSKFIFKSSNTSVASVSSKGVVTAKKKGTAVITVSCGKYAVKCKVTVK